LCAGIACFNLPTAGGIYEKIQGAENFLPLIIYIVQPLLLLNFLNIKVLLALLLHQLREKFYFSCLDYQKK
jgi:hypothetical protein